MTKEQLRKTDEYKMCINKITNYSKGFKFTINYNPMPNPKRNALNIVLNDCERNGLIESISFGVNLRGEITDETYIRI